MTSGRHLVVLAGADAGLVDATAAALREDGAVRTAYRPAALHETLDEEVDVVLVDSDLGDGPIDQILDGLRSRDADWQVAVLDADADRERDDSRFIRETFVDAVVEWDEEAVRETVSRLAARARYRRRLDEYYALAEERAALSDDEDAKPERDRLERQLDRLRRDLADAYRRIDDTSAFDAALSPRERDRVGDSRDAADGSEGREGTGESDGEASAEAESGDCGPDGA